MRGGTVNVPVGPLTLVSVQRVFTGMPRCNAGLALAGLVGCEAQPVSARHSANRRTVDTWQIR
jgi:hypothetical protein